MRIDKLNTYLGKKVKIKLFDDDVIEGELHKTDEEIFKNNLSIYWAGKNKYILIRKSDITNYYSCIFCASHIKKLEVEQ